MPKYSLEDAIKKLKEETTQAVIEKRQKLKGMRPEQKTIFYRREEAIDERLERILNERHIKRFEEQGGRE